MATASFSRQRMDACRRKGKFLLLSLTNFVVSFAKPNLFVQLGNLEDALSFRNFRDFVFQVRPRLRYEAFKEYNAFKLKHEANMA